MEGIIRQTLNHNHYSVIVVTHFVNPGMLKLLQEQKPQTSTDAHNTVLKHYNITVNHLAQEVADQVNAEKLTWKKFGGTHPGPYGNAMCAKLIENMLTKAWEKALPTIPEKKKHLNPVQLVDENSYHKGRFLAAKQVTNLKGFKLHVPDWKNIQGGKRGRFTGRPDVV